MAKLSVVVAYKVIWDISTPGLRSTQRDSNTKRMAWWTRLPKGAGEWVDPELTPRVWDGLHKRNLPSRIFEGDELIYECHDYDMALKIRGAMEQCGDLLHEYKRQTWFLWEPAALTFWEQLARLARGESITCVTWVEKPEEFHSATPPRYSDKRGYGERLMSPGRVAYWSLQTRGFRIGALQCLRCGQARQGIAEDAERLPLEAFAWDKEETAWQRKQPEYNNKQAFLALYELAQARGLLQLEEVEKPEVHQRWVLARSGTNYTRTKGEVHCTRAGPVERLAEQRWPTAGLVIVEVTGYQKVVARSDLFPSPAQSASSKRNPAPTPEAPTESREESPLAIAMREAMERKSKK